MDIETEYAGSGMTFLRGRGLGRVGTPTTGDLLTRCENAYQVGQRVQKEAREKAADLATKFKPQFLVIELANVGEDFQRQITTATHGLIAPTEAEIRERSADLQTQPADKDSAAAAIRESQWLNWVLDLDDDLERVGAVRAAIEDGEETAFRALLSAPGVVVRQLGLAPAVIGDGGVIQQESEIDRLRARWAERRSPEAARELSQLRNAVRRAKASLAEAERVVESICFPDRMGGYAPGGRKVTVTDGIASVDGDDEGDDE